MVFHRPTAVTGHARVLPKADDDWLEVHASSGTTLRVRTCRHPRARRLRLTVTADGARVTCPHGVSMRAVRAFVQQQVAWLERKLAELQGAEAAALPLVVGRDDRISLRGQALTLSWRAAPVAAIEHGHGGLVLALPRPWDRRTLVRARQLLHDCMETAIRRDVATWLPGHVAQLGRAPTGLRIRLMKSQWGSLGIHDRLGLDLSLALAPPEVLHYVLVHELAHLMQRNHSPRFWAQVARLMPDYGWPRDWLGQHGSPLKAQARRLLQARSLSGFGGRGENSAA